MRGENWDEKVTWFGDLCVSSVVNGGESDVDVMALALNENGVRTWHEVLYRTDGSSVRVEETDACQYCQKPCYRETAGKDIQVLGIVQLSNSPGYGFMAPLELCPLATDVASRLASELRAGFTATRQGCHTEGCPGAMKHAVRFEQALAEYNDPI